jgi:hypothetical protein
VPLPRWWWIFLFKVPLSTWEAFFFMLIGLGSAWAGISRVRANRSPVPDGDEQVRRPMSLTEIWLWLTASVIGGVGLLLLGLTTLRYAKGQYIVVPASAPLIDRVMWILAIVFMCGNFALLYALAWVRRAHERHSPRADSSAS